MFHLRIIDWLFPDKRTQREQDQEREFIKAVNSLKTLSTTERGGMSIDPEEVREIIVASRHDLRHLNKALNEAANTPCEHADAIQHISWRRLASGLSVQYVCLQSITTGGYAVVCANLFSGDSESLPPWLNAGISMQVAAALKASELKWHETIKDAMDAWDHDL
ncbi:hypothetical protein C206_10560 [Pseudomonas putida TRO1]|uniref:Uncharacterized protein n=1 Tax=Pseudomonas putida TRO1 TaxID=1227924 RepID=A0AAD2WCL1_PSEPU|nr:MULTISPECIES: hypothetical protein [Pseudomonas]ELS0927679.1 hypothetical protein [Pseudomonas putida]ENY77770.1 hypothetical protein C206_10560 [Pseudomonas putida TRO1]MBH3348901.1 hypothetical protein [Pseudomonas putida]UWH21047.1 hypothetical protein KW568_18670 [Pseudomonas sp. HD6515]HDS0937480.1 hypothetical protein [Pseudomonas putida]